MVRCSFNDPYGELQRREESAVGVDPEVGDLTRSFILEEPVGWPAGSLIRTLKAARLFIQYQTVTGGGTVPVSHKL